MNDINPAFRKDAFSCPVCGAYAYMTWTELLRYDNSLQTEFYIAECARCRKTSLWKKSNLTDKSTGLTYQMLGDLIYPDTDIAILPEEDMPEDVKKDYFEASRVLSKSPRAAAALLRLGLQKLCKHLGENGDNINDDIRALSRKDIIPPDVVKVADTIRITGNNAIHPGEMSEDDIDYVAVKMFGLLNFIVRKSITDPKELDLLYKMVPEGPRNSAERKDAKAKENKQ